MKPFSYLAPPTVDDAIAALGASPGRAQVIAGGQSLLLAMKERTATPPVLVSLSGIAELRGWHYTEAGELEVGAATTYAALAAGALVGWHALLCTAAADLADRPVRTMGTIGGALCQGDPRFDIPALAAGLDARVRLRSVAGERTVPAGDLYADDGRPRLRPDELLTAVIFPALDRFSGAGFEKFRYRVFDAAIISVTAAVRLSGDGTITEARISVGAASPAPRLAAHAAASLTGQHADRADLAAAAAAARDEVLPGDGAATRLAAYQRELAATLLARALHTALSKTRSEPTCPR